MAKCSPFHHPYLLSLLLFSFFHTGHASKGTGLSVYNMYICFSFRNDQGLNILSIDHTVASQREDACPA